MKHVTIYTDGACNRNPGGCGGWAAVLTCGSARKEISGYIPAPTTNNRAELAAVVEAIGALKEPCEVTLKTDSSTFELWFNGSRRKRGMRKGLKNQDLLALVNDAAVRHQVRVEWIKGHSGIEENERCDELATGAMRSKVNPNARYCTARLEVAVAAAPEWPAVGAMA